MLQPVRERKAAITAAQTRASAFVSAAAIISSVSSTSVTSLPTGQAPRAQAALGVSSEPLIAIEGASMRRGRVAGSLKPGTGPP